jgi:outer membrane protein OmpA-like peptidoglycan-associated protein
MKRPVVTALVPLLLALAAGVGAQEQDLPPGAKSKVLDLVFKVEDFGAKSVDFAVKETDTEVRIELAADVLFDFDKATLRPQAEDSLSRAAGLVKERAGGAVRIEGHTDNKGNDAYNQRLSERRAEAVRQWFVRHGMGTLQFSVQGFGETRPVAPNTRPDGSDDPDGRQKNRRVEIVISKRG